MASKSTQDSPVIKDLFRVPPYMDSPSYPSWKIDRGSCSNASLTYVMSELYDLQKRIEHLEKRPTIYNTIMDDILSDKFGLSRPIVIVIEKYTEEYIARIPELEIFGSGTTESESIQNLKKETISLYEELSASDESELGPLPAMWKRILQGLILSIK